MLPIYYVGDWHSKNKNGLQLVKDRVVKPWNGEQDGIIFTNELHLEIIQSYEKVIVGPGVDFKQGTDFFKSYDGKKNIIFNTLSPWNKRIHEKYGYNPKVKYITLPFPVDVERFQPVPKKKRFFIYIKLVPPIMVHTILDFIKQYDSLMIDYEYHIFTYGSYQESDYINYIQSAEFGIWVGRHESQGFALEEALSCNCPLFVYDITSMKDEYMNDGTYPWSTYPYDLPATSASYFDETCGMICKNKESLHHIFDSFLQMLPQFTPRQFVLENLTTTQFIKQLEKIFEHTA